MAPSVSQWWGAALGAGPPLRERSCNGSGPQGGDDNSLEINHSHLLWLGDLRDHPCMAR
jgi:hypothetical protein